MNLLVLRQNEAGFEHLTGRRPHFLLALDTTRPLALGLVVRSQEHDWIERVVADVLMLPPEVVMQVAVAARSAARVYALAVHAAVKHIAPLGLVVAAWFTVAGEA